MCWSSGSEIARPLIEITKKTVQNDDDRRKIYKVLYNTLCNQDWDTVDEVMGIDPVFDELALENESLEYFV